MRKSMFWAAGIARTLLSLTYFSLVLSAVQKISITPDKGTTLSFSSSPSTGSGCKVCTQVQGKRQCDSAKTFSTGPVSVELECLKPQGPFNVEVSRTIDCTRKSCSSDVQTTSSYDVLRSLNRKFVWNLKAAAPNAAKIDFGRTGLRQIRPFETCDPDQHIFTYEVFQNSGNVLVGKYCNSGQITNAQALGSSRISLELPAEKKLQNINFDVSPGEEIKSLARISVSLPQGQSLDLFSPNYTGSFPDDDVMEWHFVVPEKHKASIQLLNLTQPRCLKKEAAVEYHSVGHTALLVGLTEAQPEQRDGSFTLTLRNCQMDRTRAGSTGLSTNIRVSTSRENTLVLCEVDLRKLPGFSLHLKKLNPFCIMKEKSLSRDDITLPSGSITQLSFEACRPQDVLVTASKKMGCSQARTCPRFSLDIPPLPQCLPAQLRNVTWALSPPPHGTVELGCASGTLRQELPGQPCNDSISIKMAEDDGLTIGTFCRNGSITKLQIHTNITITVNGTLVPSRILTARIKEEISERYIFRVSPRKNTPLLLATPGWPKGMSPYSTVSWIVTVPPKMEAHLMFTDLNQPKCSNRHTNIRIQRVGSLEEDYSRREDEKPENEITISQSFYLNMSNCLPERGDFSVLTQVTLKKSQLMTIILAIVATLLVIFIAVLVVVCLVIRKKKKKLNHQVSIYNPNGTSFLPGQNGLPRSQDEDEYHVYEDIEDTLVYTHLLRKGAQMGIYGEFDNKQESSLDSQKALAARESCAGDIEVGEYQEYPQKPNLPQRPLSHVQAMVDNDLYESGVSEGERSPSLGPRLDPEGGEHLP